MRIAVALGVSLLMVVRVLVKRGKSVADAGLTPPVEIPEPIQTMPTEAIVVYLDAYRRERARSLGYRPASHSASWTDRRIVRR